MNMDLDHHDWGYRTSLNNTQLYWLHSSQDLKELCLSSRWTDAPVSLNLYQLATCEEK
jgi:hypothetical protein